jgi:hypothetical protein
MYEKNKSITIYNTADVNIMHWVTYIVKHVPQVASPKGFIDWKYTYFPFVISLQMVGTLDWIPNYINRS